MSEFMFAVAALLPSGCQLTCVSVQARQRCGKVSDCQQKLKVAALELVVANERVYPKYHLPKQDNSVIQLGRFCCAARLTVNTLSI